MWVLVCGERVIWLMLIGYCLFSCVVYFCWNGVLLG